MPMCTNASSSEENIKYSELPLSITVVLAKGCNNNIQEIRGNKRKGKVVRADIPYSHNK
jgi:hypothetical protein